MKKLLIFTYLQAISCIFPVIIFAALAISQYVVIPFIPRYDFILIVCILAQIVLIWTKLETYDELKVICVFHLIGLALELFKTQMLLVLSRASLYKSFRSSVVQWLHVCECG